MLQFSIYTHCLLSLSTNIYLICSCNEWCSAVIIALFELIRTTKHLNLTSLIGTEKLSDIKLVSTICVSMVNEDIGEVKST